MTSLILILLDNPKPLGNKWVLYFIKQNLLFASLIGKPINAAIFEVPSPTTLKAFLCSLIQFRLAIILIRVIFRTWRRVSLSN